MANKFEKMILEIEKASCFSIQEWWIENGYLTIQNRAESSGENHCFQLLYVTISPSRSARCETKKPPAMRVVMIYE